LSLHIWMEENSLDPHNPSAKQKVKKLIKALNKERDWVLKELRKGVENIGSTTLTTLQQIQFAIEDKNNPLWGSFGPMQGTAQYLERSSVYAAKLHQISETLDAIYSLFPEFRPAKVDLPKKPEPKPDSVKTEGRQKSKRREPTTPNPVDPETKPKKKGKK
jgi:hypothetical protein